MVQLTQQLVQAGREPARPPVRRVPTVRFVLGALFLAGVAGIGAARWWSGAGGEPIPAGLPDPGAVTAVALPVAQYLHELAGVAVVGLLFLRCIGNRSVSAASGYHLARVATIWAWVWVASTLAWIVFTMSDLIGVPVWKLGAHLDLIYIVSGTNRVLAETATFWLALALAMFEARAARLAGAIALLVVATAALLPAALTGHASHHASPVMASVVLGVHVVAAAIWVGGLLALVVHLRSFPDQLSATLRRFSTAALLCVLAVGVSGVTESALTLNGWVSLWDSNRGQLVVAKTAALGMLVVLGHLHRRRTVAPAASGRLSPLLRLASVELVLMGTTMGLAVALSTTP